MSAHKSKGRFCYEYPRPALTVDIAVLRPSTEHMHDVLLIRRKDDPFKDRWALPGGFVNENESLEAAACRELVEETGVRKVTLYPLGAFGDPGRDPRGWTVSIAYYTIVDPAQIHPEAADDAAEVGWFPLAHLPPLAFDHSKILAHLKRRQLTESVGGKAQTSTSAKSNGGPSNPPVN